MFNLTRQERIAILFVSALLVLGVAVNHFLDQNPAWLRLDIDTLARESPAVNVNTASEEELARLPGIGAVTARSIIAYRSVNGPFERMEDLKKVKGIGEKKFVRMKEYLKL